MTKKPKAYSYLRFSTPEQMKGDSQRRQTQLAEEYAQRNGLELDKELSVADLGVSAFHGKNVETGALGKFLRLVQDGVIEPDSYLLVESLDRISRRTARKAARVLEDICEAGVKVVTLSDGKLYDIDTLDDDPMAFIMAVLIFQRANEESATKSRRVRAAWDNKRAKAADRPLTRQVPGWISYVAGHDGEPDRLELIPERAATVRRIVDQFLAGVGKESIAKALNADGVHPFGRAKGWGRTYVDKILKSPALVGEYVPHVTEHVKGRKRRIPQEPVLDYYPAVIDRDRFDRVQGLLSANASKGRTSSVVRNLLAHLARCPKCGATMTRVTKGSAAKAGKPFLVCVDAKEGRGCTYRSVVLEDVETAVLSNPAALVHEAPLYDLELAGSIDAVEAELMGTEDAVENLLDALQRRPGSRELLRRLDKLEASKDELQTRLDELRQDAAASEPKVKELRLAELREALSTQPLDRGKANVALRQVVDHVVVDYEQGELVFNWKHGGRSSVILPTYALMRQRAS